MKIQEIKLFMKQKGITQIELAEKSQIPLTTIRYIFSGRTQTPRIDTMQAIERALGIENDNFPSFLPRSTTSLNEKESRLLGAFKGLIPPMQDYVLEMVEKLVEKNIDKVKKV